MSHYLNKTAGVTELIQMTDLWDRTKYTHLVFNRTIFLIYNVKLNPSAPVFFPVGLLLLVAKVEGGGDC